ncbi:sulfate transporter [Cellulomonas bogoriensis 69B4 = DSM 16987]|uniref:Sulfate transporter n=1 Tax=Cellulomonas bogoriensis 69B4 = DSM 16987 TaxID=1386082 RepID=A0A0A0BYE4_9CELL|nr:sulfate transporter [Cellulomonas bogoriensis 69B4 = DSM 16987]
MEEPGAVHLVLAGEIDLAVHDDLTSALEDAARSGRTVDVECSQVTFMDSSGLSALMWLSNVAAEPPVLRGAPQHLRDLLALTGSADAFTLP